MASHYANLDWMAEHRKVDLPKLRLSTEKTPRKGPSLDPAQRRLAVHVEDHPLEYGSFEGAIPKGEYGGGTVVLWDRGRWRPDGDAALGYRRGKLEFTLEGRKLKGRFALVRMRGKASGAHAAHHVAGATAARSPDQRRVQRLPRRSQPGFPCDRRRPQHLRGCAICG